MNVGDKYLCKKTLLYKNYNIFFENIYYKIIKKHTNYIIIYYTLNNTPYYGYLVKNNNKIYHFTFSLNKFSSINSPFLFFDYFYTKQEERKLKLDKIRKITL